MHSEYQGGGKERSLLKPRSTEDFGDRIDINKIMKGIFRHTTLFVVSGLVLGALALFMAIRMQQTYKAQTVLLFNSSDTQPLKEELDILHFSLPSAVEMITLPSNLRAVNGILGLEMTPDELLSYINVDLPLLDSNLINIVVENTDPALAIDIANTLGTVAVKNSQNLARRQWQEAYVYYKDRGIALDNELDEQLARIHEFRREKDFAVSSEGSLSSPQELSVAEQQLQQANIDYESMLVEYQNLKREFSNIPSLLQGAASGDGVLAARVQQIESALLDARLKYAPNNPKIRALERQLEEISTQASAVDTTRDSGISSQSKNPVRGKLDLDLIGMQAKLRASLKRREQFQDIVMQLEEETEQLSEYQLEFLEMLHGKMMLEKIAENNENALQAVEAKLNLAKGDLELYQQAEKALPNENLVLLIALPLGGLFVGLALGLIAAIILEFMDQKIRTQRQIELLYTLPCIISIPQFIEMTNEKLKKKSRFFVREILKRLRKENGSYRTLGVISSTEGEGKTFLARAFAEHWKDQGHRVLYLQFEHASSSPYGPLPTPTKSLEEFWKGNAKEEEIIATGPIDVIRIQDSSYFLDLAGTDEMKLWVDKMGKKYDRVVLDLPGIIDEEAAPFLAKLAEESLFIIGSSVADQSYVDSSLNELDIHGIRPAGIVLNRVDAAYLEDARLITQANK